MKTIAAIKSESKEDALKYAYAFMQTQQLNLKECGFLNPKPTKVDSSYLFPRDMYSASYHDKVPTWEDFRTNQAHLASPAFACVASIDKKDQKRVNFTLMGDTIVFNCYGDYENEAKKVLDDISAIHSTLK